MKAPEIVIAVLVWTGTIWLSWSMSMFITNDAIKGVSIKQELDIQESRAREEYLGQAVLSLNRAIDPEFVKALQQFTAEVKQENNYLASFSHVGHS